MLRAVVARQVRDLPQHGLDRLGRQVAVGRDVDAARDGEAAHHAAVFVVVAAELVVGRPAGLVVDEQDARVAERRVDAAEQPDLLLRKRDGDRDVAVGARDPGGVEVAAEHAVRVRGHLERLAKLARQARGLRLGEGSGSEKLAGGAAARHALDDAELAVCVSCALPEDKVQRVAVGLERGREGRAGRVRRRRAVAGRPVAQPLRRPSGLGSDGEGLAGGQAGRGEVEGHGAGKAGCQKVARRSLSRFGWRLRLG